VNNTRNNNSTLMLAVAPNEEASETLF